MRHALVRACQGLTAVAAILTVLWACGSPPTAPSPPGQRLLGTWGGSIATSADATAPAQLRIAETTFGLGATMQVGGATYVPDSNQPSTISGVNFVFRVRSGSAVVILTGEISPDGTRLTGQADGFEATPRAFTFTKR